MKATFNQNFALTRGGASVSSNMMAAAATHTRNHQDGSNSDATMHVTLRCLDVGDTNLNTLENSNTVSWEVAHDATCAAPMHENPLLALIPRNKILIHPKTKTVSPKSTNKFLL